MYIINDICYAGRKSTTIKIVEAVPHKDRILVVTFSNGEKRIYDTKKLTGPIFKILDDKDIFGKIEIFHGIITWNNGKIDVAPETVYSDSEPYNESREYMLKLDHNPSVAEKRDQYN